MKINQEPGLQRDDTSEFRRMLASKRDNLAGSQVRESRTIEARERTYEARLSNFQMRPCSDRPTDHERTKVSAAAADRAAVDLFSVSCRSLARSLLSPGPVLLTRPRSPNPGL